MVFLLPWEEKNNHIGQLSGNNIFGNSGNGISIVDANGTYSQIINAVLNSSNGVYLSNSTGKS